GSAPVGRRSPPGPGRRRLVVAAGVALVLLSLRGADLLDGMGRGTLRRMGAFAAQLFPPDLSGTFLASLRVPLLQTLAVAGAGPLIGVLVGAALAIPASAGLMLRGSETAGRPGAFGCLVAGVHVCARVVLAFLRGIPELLWVLVCIVAVGFGPFAGAL